MYDSISAPLCHGSAEHSTLTSLSVHPSPTCLPLFPYREVKLTLNDGSSNTHTAPPCRQHPKVKGHKVNKTPLWLSSYSGSYTPITSQTLHSILVHLVCLGVCPCNHTQRIPHQTTLYEPHRGWTTPTTFQIADTPRDRDLQGGPVVSLRPTPLIECFFVLRVVGRTTANAVECITSNPGSATRWPVLRCEWVVIS